ncbi:hypothetical protein GY45DRAFT_1135643 [Cubamyces sp. BRFM 1775]|nr:hypothetical protein GY45DRAFT_1135643 [Cubamyces sp. BRFM 1775]
MHLKHREPSCTEFVLTLPGITVTLPDPESITLPGFGPLLVDGFNPTLFSEPCPTHLRTSDSLDRHSLTILSSPQPSSSPSSEHLSPSPSSEDSSLSTSWTSTRTQPSIQRSSTLTSPSQGIPISSQSSSLVDDSVAASIPTTIAPSVTTTANRNSIPVTHGSVSDTTATMQGTTTPTAVTADGDPESRDHSPTIEIVETCLLVALGLIACVAVLCLIRWRYRRSKRVALGECKRSPLAFILS